MTNVRDFKRALQSKLDQKVDITIPFRAVLCDSIGLTSGVGSVWANQNTRLVWYLPIGGGQPAQIRCMRLEPVLGLGVIIGYADGSVELEVLSDDPFLRDSNTTGGSFMTVTPADFQPGGRLQLWLYSKLFVPLAVYPGTGLTVSVAPGDYEGENGERRSFVGQNNFSIAAHQPAGPNQHRLVGISISSGGALVATAGTTVSTAIAAPEPAWPANSTLLAVVDLDDTQTTISFASDIFDRRLHFSFPGPLNNYTATVDPTPTDDTADGYEPGSVWLNVTEHRAWINIVSTANAAVWRPFGNTPLATFFLHEEASDIATYLSLLETPAEDAENDDTAVVNSAGGEVLIKAFATEAGGLGLTLLPGGAWQFITYSSVDSVVGVSSIVIRVYKYEVDTTETELFNVTTPEINGLVATEYETTTVQGDFTLVATDRLVVKYYAQTTSVPNRTVHLYYEGTANYSHIHTPLSSSIAGGGWPYDKILTVSATNTNANYTTIQDAINAATNNTAILIDPGTYSEALTIDVGMVLVGYGGQVSILGQLTIDSIFNPFVVTLDSISITDDGTGAVQDATNGYCVKTSNCDSKTYQFHNCKFSCSRGTHISDLWLTGGSGEMYNCDLALGTFGSTTAYMIRTAGGSLIDTGSTYLTTGATDFSISAGDTLTLVGSKTDNGNYTGAGTLTGYFLDDTDDLHVTGGALEMTEIATPANPVAGDNKLYFKAGGGLYKLNSAGAEVEVGADSWPYPEVHTVGANGNFTAIESALNDAGVGAGDVIEAGESTSEAAVGLDKALTVRSVSREFTLTVTTSANGLNISANDARAENLNVVNTTVAATTYGVYCNATGIVLEHVSALVAAGGTTRYGIAVPASMSVTLRECTAQGTGGGGTNAGLVVDGTATVYGGEFSGDNYSLLVGAAGVVTLKDVTLSGNIYASAGGVIRGTARDTKGRDCGVIVTNTSGGTVAAGDVGYLDEAGEFKTTTTANLTANWHVVTVGGLDNGPVFVKRIGNATVNYTGSAPAQGDYLVTSTSAGDAQASTTMRPEIFAVCLAAGSGGTVEALLLCNTIPVDVTTSQVIARPAANITGTDFVATIASLPGGATLTYNAPGTGTEDNLPPSNTGNLGKIVLWNTTRSTSALISDCNTGTNTITLTANVPAGWQVNDAITIRSQTNTNTYLSAYYVEYKITSTEIPTLARSVDFEIGFFDSTSVAAAQRCILHPYVAFNAAARRIAEPAVAGKFFYRMAPTTLIDRTFTLQATASGAGTSLYIISAFRANVAAP